MLTPVYLSKITPDSLSTKRKTPPSPEKMPVRTATPPMSKKQYLSLRPSQLSTQIISSSESAEAEAEVALNTLR